MKLAAVGPATARALRGAGWLRIISRKRLGASLGEGLAVRAAGERVLYGDARGCPIRIVRPHSAGQA